MGATATGKSRLSVDVATKYSGEIINCDKMQVYKGLDIVTNKITESEMKGVPHHLLGEIQPEVNFTAQDFCYHALAIIQRVVRLGRLPVIVGGSNSFIEALVGDPIFGLQSIYECCFLWLDVSLPILYSYAERRVDQMLDSGLLNEVRSIFDPKADYTIGIRKSIGVPELEEYLRVESNVDDKTAQRLLDAAISDIKSNTCKLIDSQLSKINRLKKELNINRIDATTVFEKQGNEAEDAWEDYVLQPCFKIVGDFLNGRLEARKKLRDMRNYDERLRKMNGFDDISGLLTKETQEARLRLEFKYKEIISAHSRGE
nr:tRNA isopentenyltransferase [Tanacetum cinerariifolium]